MSKFNCKIGRVLQLSLVSNGDGTDFCLGCAYYSKSICRWERPDTIDAGESMPCMPNRIWVLRDTANGWLAYD